MSEYISPHLADLCALEVDPAQYFLGHAATYNLLPDEEETCRERRVAYIKQDGETVTYAFSVDIIDAELMEDDSDAAFDNNTRDATDEAADSDHWYHFALRESRQFPLSATAATALFTDTEGLNFGSDTRAVVERVYDFDTDNGALEQEVIISVRDEKGTMHAVQEVRSTTGEAFFNADEPVLHLEEGTGDVFLADRPTPSSVELPEELAAQERLMAHLDVIRILAVLRGLDPSTRS